VAEARDIHHLQIVLLMAEHGKAIPSWVGLDVSAGGALGQRGAKGIALVAAITNALAGCDAVRYIGSTSSVVL
jgi:hypothetical protein